MREFSRLRADSFAVGGIWSGRMTVVRLQNGSSIIYSAIAMATPG